MLYIYTQNHHLPNFELEFPWATLCWNVPYFLWDACYFVFLKGINYCYAFKYNRGVQSSPPLVLWKREKFRTPKLISVHHYKQTHCAKHVTRQAFTT